MQHEVSKLPGLPLPTADLIHHQILNPKNNNAARTISTTIIQLPSSISLTNIDLGKIANACNLYIVGGLHKVHASKCTVGNDASASSRFSAKRDGFALLVTDGAIRNGWK